MVVTKDCSKDYCCSHPKVCCQEAGESEVVITMYSYPYLLNPPLPHPEEFRQESMPELIQPVRKRHNSWSDDRDFSKRKNISDAQYILEEDKQFSLRVRTRDTSPEVKKLKRKDLEKMVMQQMCAALTEVGPVAELKMKLNIAENQLEQYHQETLKLIRQVCDEFKRKKFMNTNPIEPVQVEDLKLVLRRFVTQLKTKNREISPPVKLTRSVGLQVTELTERLDGLKLNNASQQELESSMPVLRMPKNQAGGSSTSPILVDTDEELDQDSDDIVCVDAVGTSETPCSHLPPLPAVTFNVNEHLGLPPVAPKPTLNAVKIINKIQLSWDIFGEEDYAKIATYKIMAFVEKSSNVSSLEGWKKAGEVQGLALPMTCSISVILDDVGRSRYHFAIQAKDIHGRSTPFSDIATISC